MKYLYILLILCFGITASYSQNLGFNYQGIARQDGQALENQDLGIRLSILDNSNSVVYQETHSIVSSDLGFFNVTVGMGFTSDDFSAIDWSQSLRLLTEMDVIGGTDYTDMGTQDLNAVPLAMYALNSEPGPQGIPGPEGPQGLIGSIGPPGPKGDTGATGATGSTGATGATGPMGVTGPQGLPGATGATGPQGIAGAKGDIGAPGPMGAIGPEGPQGDDGATGPMGVTGPQGPQGDDGAPGPMGAIGPEGPQGDDGATGPMGATGPQGPQGPAGPPQNWNSLPGIPSGFSDNVDNVNDGDSNDENELQNLFINPVPSPPIIINSAGFNPPFTDPVFIEIDKGGAGVVLTQWFDYFLQYYVPTYQSLSLSGGLLSVQPFGGSVALPWEKNNDNEPYVFERVGLGTNNPSTNLHIVDNNNTSFRINNGSDNFSFGVSSTSGSLLFFNDNSTSTVAGIREDGSYFMGSDSKLKMNIGNLTSQLSKVLKLRPTMYNYKATSDINSYGFIAQEVQALFPDLVDELIEDKDGEIGNLAVNMTGFIPVLTSAIQEQQKQIESQKNELNELRKDVEVLKSLIKE